MIKPKYQAQGWRLLMVVDSLKLMSVDIILKVRI